MLHPATELRIVAPDIGVGVFATAFIPTGTVVYVKDPLEITIDGDDARMRDPVMGAIIERYSYVEPSGQRILSWDLAKYMNHSCDPNTISTGYGFEIAIRDIEAGEEITDDYGLLNVEREMRCLCGSDGCREWIRPDDLLRNHDRWDSLVYQALTYFYYVEQPLGSLLDGVTRRKLEQFLDTGKGFLSVKQLAAPGRPQAAIRVSIADDEDPQSLAILGS
jgi:hypothetical protein